MSDSLTTLTTKLQALLMDGGTLFTSTTCTAAIRQALGQLNLRMPIHAGTLIDTVDGQYEYELTAALAGATPLTVTDVLLSDPSGGEYHVPLTFEHYIEDERWFIRLETPQAGSGQLIVRFSQAHTINGLDSETESTLSAQADVVLLDGAAAQACTIASAGKVEANNLDPQTADNYGKAATRFDIAFGSGIAALTRRRRIQRSVPDTRAWNDEWHIWPDRTI
jgi:hypothetical protein